MEMNTRLQVEHPVTEEITGQDLVEWQLRVASGEKLPKVQDQLRIRGHAIEARLYAEDPAKGFLPSTGVLERFHLPDAVRPSRYRAELSNTPSELPLNAVARIETGVEQGSVISPFYDPMIAKVICHADDRRTAALGLARLVNDAQVYPVRTNASFLWALLINPDFVSGRIDTGFIEKHGDDVIFSVEPPGWLLILAARKLVTPTANPMGFRLNGPNQTKVTLLDRGTRYVADLNTPVSYDQRQYALVTGDERAVFATMQGATWRFTGDESRGTGTSHGLHDGEIEAPMPGKVTAVEVKKGAKVEKGQRLLTLEAMKMEHALTAPFDGTVAELNATAGSQVTEGQLLVKVEPAEQSASS
jgi:3-methylcrotonyl-CoA carboxylase alpha subunit